MQGERRMTLTLEYNLTTWGNIVTLDPQCHIGMEIANFKLLAVHDNKRLMAEYGRCQDRDRRAIEIA